MTDTTTDFHDVTSGSNIDGYKAMTGYDAVTGLGSPIISRLVNDLATATATGTTTLTTKIAITKPSSGSSGGWGGGGGWGSGGSGSGGWGGQSGRDEWASPPSFMTTTRFVRRRGWPPIRRLGRPIHPRRRLGAMLTDVADATLANSPATNLYRETWTTESLALAGHFGANARQADATAEDEFLPASESAAKFAVDVSPVERQLLLDMTPAALSQAVDYVFSNLPTTAQPQRQWQPRTPGLNNLRTRKPTFRGQIPGAAIPSKPRTTLRRRRSTCTPPWRSPLFAWQIRASSPADSEKARRRIG